MYGDLYPQHFHASFYHANGYDWKTDKPKPDPVQEVPQWYLKRHPEASYNDYINELHEYLNGL